MTQPPIDSDRLERELAEILECSDRRAALEAACRRCPELAAPLREAYDALDVRRLLDEPVVARSDCAVGKSVDGYELQEVLGRGGMGVVYRARDRELDRHVALKVLRPELVHFEDSRARFLREIRAVSRLRHPGIVAVHAAGEDEHGAPYFTMELIEGASLAETIARLRRRGASARRGQDLIEAAVVGTPGNGSGASGSSAFGLRTSWSDACLQVARAVAEALAHAHDERVFHRDVKPSNIILDAYGRARLLDFGLAHLESAQPLTKSASLLGSLPYMPPEQISGEGGAEFGPRQEVYSLGVTLLELLTLEQPFLASSAEETRRRVTAGEASSALRDRTLGRDVRTVCATAIDLDPKRRYATMRAFAADLDNLLERRPIVARPPGPILRGWRFVQRNPTLSVAGLLGVALLLVGGFALRTAQHAATERSQAMQRLIDANLEFSVDFVQGMRRLQGNSAVRAELLSELAGQLEELESEVADDPPRLGGIGQVYVTLAQVLGDPSAANVGERERADVYYRRAIGLTERLPQDDLRTALLRCSALRGRTAIARFERDFERATQYLESALAAVEPWVVDVPANDKQAAAIWDAIASRERLAAVTGSRGDDMGAIAGFEAVVGLCERLLAFDPEDAEARLVRSRAHGNLGKGYYRLGRFEDAVDALGGHVEFLDARLAEQPQDAGRLLARLHGALHYPEFLIRADRFAEALEFCEEDLPRAESLAELDPENRLLPEVLLHLHFHAGWARQELVSVAIRDRGDPTLSSDEVDACEAARSHLRSAQAIASAMAGAGDLRADVRTDKIDERLAQLAALLGERD